MRALAPIAVVACACGDHGIVEVHIPGTPSYVVYHDRRGVWLTPERDVDGTWRLDVEDDYELWSVCTGPDGAFFTQGLRATLDDGDTQTLAAWPGIGDCDEPRPGFPGLRLTGAVLQSGTIDSCADTQTSLSPTGWQFQLLGSPGRCDVIATDYDRTETLAALRLVHRELELAGDHDLGAIDLFDGIPLGQLSVPIGGASLDATTFGSVWLTSGGTTAQIAGLPGGSQTLTVPLVPDGLGREVVQARALSRGADQRAVVDVTPHMASIAMLAPAPAEWLESTQSITWRAIDDRATAVELAVVGEACATCPIRSRRVTATQRWLDAHRDHALGFATDLPGYDAAWQIDAALPYVATFSLLADEGDAHYAAQVQIHPSETGAGSAR